MALHEMIDCPDGNLVCVDTWTVNGGGPFIAYLCPDDKAMICVTGVNGLHTEYRFKAE